MYTKWDMLLKWLTFTSFIPHHAGISKKIPGEGVWATIIWVCRGGGHFWGILSVILQRNGLEWLPNLGNSLTFSLLVFGLQSKYASSILHVSYTTLYQSVFQIILNSEKLFFSHFENIQCVLTIKDFQLIHVCTANLKRSGACYINHRTHEDPWNLYHGTEMITLYFIMLIYLNISK